MQSTSTDTMPELPSLDPEVTLLTSDGRATGALQSLVLDHLLLSEGEALWIDAASNAATTSLARLSPSRRILDRIRVARAFTAFQHYSLVDDLEHAVTPDTSLVVAPAVEWFYANDDLTAGEGQEMLDRALELLADLSAAYDVPVLVSRHASGTLGRVVEAYADVELECVITEFGPRFSGAAYETLVFDCDGMIQTTLAFWCRVLEDRHPAHVSEESREVTHVGPY